MIINIPLRLEMCNSYLPPYRYRLCNGPGSSSIWKMRCSVCVKVHPRCIRLCRLPSITTMIEDGVAYLPEKSSLEDSTRVSKKKRVSSDSEALCRDGFKDTLQLHRQASSITPTLSPISPFSSSKSSPNSCPPQPPSSKSTDQSWN